MTHDKTLRITADVIVFLCVIFGWWYVAILVGLISAWVFPRYAELVIAAFMYDVLYTMHLEKGIWGYMFTLGTAGLLMLIGYLKTVVRNYA